MGIVTIAVLEAKSLWKVKVSEDILPCYQQWLSQFHHIKEISVICWLSVDVGKKSDIELHIYSDAFNTAYGEKVNIDE